MVMNAYGDSITAGHGVALADSYPNLLAYDYNVSLNNFAVSGDMAEDQSWRTFGVNPADFTTIMLGTNDSYQYGNVASTRAGFIKYLRSIILLSAGLNIVPAISMTKVGAWQNQTAPDNIGCYTTQIGDTITASVNGSSIYIGRFLYSGATPVVEVRVNGTLVDTITDNCTGYGPTGNGRPFATGATRVPGTFPNAFNTVQLKLVGGTLFMPEYIAGSNSAFKKPVFVSNVIRKQAAGYGNGDSDTNCLNYCNDILTCVNDLYTDGLKVFLVDNHASIDPSTDLGDVTHPNTAGHVKLHNNFKTAIDNYLTSISTGTPTPPTVLNGTYTYAAAHMAITYVGGVPTTLHVT